MTAPSLESFFSGGGKSFSWKDKPIGTTVAGTITAVGAPTQQTDPADQKPQFKRDGVTPKMSVRIDLATNERDPQDPEDDGSRGLYVQGWMQGAIGDAMRRAGHQGPPQVGAQLTVQLVAREPNDRPGLNPINKFAAHYVPAAAQAAGQFFAQGNGQPTAAVAQQQFPPQPVAPPLNSPGPAPQFAQPVAPPQVYQQPVPVQQTVMQPPPQQVVQAPPVQQLPERPASIAEGPWNAMDDATKIAVAATMANVPNF